MLQGHLIEFLFLNSTIKGLVSAIVSAVVIPSLCCGCKSSETILTSLSVYPRIFILIDSSIEAQCVYFILCMSGNDRISSTKK